jgi:hypothetical protein
MSQNPLNVHVGHAKRMQVRREPASEPVDHRALSD